MGCQPCTTLHRMLMLHCFNTVDNFLYNSEDWYSAVDILLSSTDAEYCMITVLMLILSVAVGYPLTVIGAIFGRSIGGTFDAPSRPKPVAREIPSVAWYRTPIVHCIIGGFLPFRL